LTALATLAACSPDTSTPTAVQTSSSSNMSAQGFAHARVCPGAEAGSARCHSWVRVDGAGNPAATTTPSGYGPADLRSAYGLTTSGSSSQVIAIVDAYDDPNAENDMNVYRAQYGLPACTT